VPPLHKELLDEADHNLMTDIQKTKETVSGLLENYKFRDALFEVIDLSRKGNKYLQDKAPWILAKETNTQDNKQALIDNSLHICLQLCANLAIYIQPFLPATAKKMCHMMKVVDKMLDWENGGSLDLLKVNYALRAPELLFRKIEDEEILSQIEKLKSNLISNTPTTTQKVETTTSAKERIQFDDFAKIDLRIGTILSAEKVEKADKLLKLSVALGEETRTIVSGIAQHFNPEEIVQKQVIVVANLAPRKMRGIESEGMILMTENEEGKLVFVSPNTLVPSGKTVN
jgi:methionyl-tRNA synthetase